MADLEVVAELARREGRQLGLVAKVMSVLPDSAGDLGFVQLVGADEEVIERALKDQLVLVGFSHHLGTGQGEVRPRSPQALKEREHPYVMLKVDRGGYRHTQLWNFRHGDLAIVRCGELLDSDGNVIADDSLSAVGAEARIEAAKLAEEEQRKLEERLEEIRSQEAVRQAEEVASEVERERRREEQWDSTTTFDGGDDGETDAPIEQLHHRAIRSVGRVIWEWWVPDGIDTGGPMTREYGEAVVKWSDGTYYYLQIHDGYHTLTTLGPYGEDWEAVDGGKRHSLYSDDEREVLDGQLLDDLEGDECDGDG